MRQFLVPMAIGAFALIAMIAVADIEGLPIRDPDARYVGSPLALISLIVAVMVVLDVIPRGFRMARTMSVSPGDAIRSVFTERWWGRRGLIVISSILGFYATYLAYRNLKSFLPFVTDGVLHDSAMLSLDKTMSFGTHPSTLLHDVLGTAVAAPVLSSVYLAFLTFVPLSLGVALVWSSRVAAGVWYVTALTIDWVLGIISYYLLPTLGPVYARPELFSGLPHTGVTQLQASLFNQRDAVMAHPLAVDAVQSIAGFASLHAAVVFTAALVAQFVGVHKLIRTAMWVYFGLTLLATIYFGWHYLLDDVAGIAIGAIAVYGGGMLTGFRLPPFGKGDQVRRRGAPATTNS
ncbi:hypothetical protein BH10ACT11_BH10ACT11_19470 [soil metagenome]